MTDEEPLDSHVPTFAEVSAAATLVVGAVCAVIAVVINRRWKT